ncbi:hypothetical protein DPMN_000909 [Dreissena polymorpha]|uniref:Transmembrane protein n=1 Tax=Dreissena polymorpha TaxID=45954 RepID=A0A9D4MHJ3_DREPO|nr:hypothetical protein DPMN_000909 [Dreissena polymorpha]
MENTRDLKSLYLVGKRMELVVHNLLSWPSLRSPWQFVFGTGPSLDKVAPKDLKLVDYSSFVPFMVMSALVLVVLFTMIYNFSVLTSIPYALAFS